jgi:hypothetical protein
MKMEMEMEMALPPSSARDVRGSRPSSLAEMDRRADATNHEIHHALEVRSENFLLNFSFWVSSVA